METEHFRLLIADMGDELSNRCFTSSVFTQPRPNADMGAAQYVLLKVGSKFTRSRAASHCARRVMSGYFASCAAVAHRQPRLAVAVEEQVQLGGACATSHFTVGEVATSGRPWSWRARRRTLATGRASRIGPAPRPWRTPGSPPCAWSRYSAAARDRRSQEG
jgi:hypothetical protein